jgi:hypothetical protein
MIMVLVLMKCMYVCLGIYLSEIQKYLGENMLAKSALIFLTIMGAIVSDYIY